MSELDLYSPIICEATVLGHRLFRNNQGRAKYQRRGETYTVPYGVGGVGGADLIGWTQVQQNSDLFILACVFTAIEVKPEGWKPPRPGTKDYKHYEDQKKFIDAVIAAGGIGGFVRSVDEYRKLVGAHD